MNKWLKRFLIMFGILFGIILASALYLSPPRFIRERGLPQYAKELPNTFADASEEFNRRVQVEFPLPTTGKQLESELSRQGYRVDTEKMEGIIIRSGFPCRYLWRINWMSNEKDSVSQVNGTYRGLCL